MPTNSESGIRRQNTYWVPETEDGEGEPQTPADPAFKLLSDTVPTVSLEPTPNWDERQGTGNYMAQSKERQQEDHEGSFTYDLGRVPIDTTGNPQDPWGYAAVRDADNNLHASLSFLDVVENNVIAANTVHDYYYNTKPGTPAHPSGATPAASAMETRIESYGRGGLMSEAGLISNPSDSGAISVEASVTFHEIRRYIMDQPSPTTNSYLHLRAIKEDGTGASADAGKDVKIENADGTQSETVTLDGTDASTVVATAATFDTMRVHVPDSLEGRLEIFEDDGSGTDTAPVGAAGQLLTYIPGAEDRDDVDGDNGVPMLGAGSFGTGSGLDTISSLGGNLRWLSSPAAAEVGGTTVTASNDIAANDTDKGLFKSYNVGDGELTVESTVWGENASGRKFGETFEGEEGKIELYLGTTHNLVVARGYCEDGGTTEREEGNAVMQSDVTFRALLPADGSDPISIATV